MFELVESWPAAEPWVFWLSIVGTGGWVLALGYLAVATRAAGASRLQWVFLGLAASLLLLGHPAPFGTLAFGSLFVAAVIYEGQASRVPGRSRPNIPGGSSQVDGCILTPGGRAGSPNMRGRKLLCRGS